VRINSVNSERSNGGRQITVAGIMAYTTLWALIIGLFRLVAKLQQGPRTVVEAKLSDTLLMVVIGMFFVAIGLPIAILLGRARQAVPISLGCFFLGFIAIPILMVVVAILLRFGIIDLD
jgi:hypothetical protein